MYDMAILIDRLTFSLAGRDAYATTVNYIFFFIDVIEMLFPQIEHGESVLSRRPRRQFIGKIVGSAGKSIEGTILIPFLRR